MTTHSHCEKNDSSTITSENLLRQLQWRYATKVFDPAKKIDAKTWAALEDTLVLSPSSFGLQPWKFFVIDNPAVRARLREFSWGQSQVTDASHLVVFTARTTLAEQDAVRMINRTAELRGVAPESLDAYKKVIMGSVNARTPQQLASWNERQLYIALGFLMDSAAMLGIDTCALEGLDPAKYDEILNLSGTGYHALCALALGYRDSGDKYAARTKIRYSKSDVIAHI